MNINNYIIYKGSGGLIHLLGGLAYCCEYVTKNRNYDLILNISNHPSFGVNFNDYFDFNYIKKYYNSDNLLNNIKFKDHLNRIPLEYIFNHIIGYENTYILNYNGHKNRTLDMGIPLEKNNDNNKIYVGHGGNSKNLIIKHIKCNKTIIDKLNKYKINEEFIAVHFRNTDRKNDINIFINEIKKYKNYKIYIATDDIKSLDIFNDQLKDYKLFYYNIPFDANGENIHFNNPDKDNIIMSLIIDIYMMYHSKIFIPSTNSLVSKFVQYLKNNNNNFFKI